MRKIIFIFAVSLCGFNVYAQETVEDICQKGKDALASKNYEQAVQYFRQAAEQNCAEAQFQLGDLYIYYDDKGISHDYDEAIYWLRRAAEQGYVKAHTYMGLCYENGLGVANNMDKAIQCYRYAAEKGEARAQSCLGNCLKIGKGVEQSEEDAVYWRRRSAEQGFTQACYNMGVYYIEHQNPNAEKALFWYDKAGQNVDAKNKVELFGTGGLYFYKDGQAMHVNKRSFWFGAKSLYAAGVMCFYLGEFEKAVDYFTRADECGWLYGRVGLGVCHIFGKGVKKDPAKGLKIVVDADTSFETYFDNPDIELRQHFGGLSSLIKAYCYYKGLGCKKNVETAAGEYLSYLLCDEQGGDRYEDLIFISKEEFDEMEEVLCQTETYRKFADVYWCVY